MGEDSQETLKTVTSIKKPKIQPVVPGSDKWMSLLDLIDKQANHKDWNTKRHVTIYDI